MESARTPTIGVFDSGIGGLSVLRHAMRRLPANYLYVADSGRAPYGDADPEWVRERSLAIATFLAEHGADAVVIACNTATALAAEAIRGSLAIPVIAMEPAVKPAAGLSRSGRIAVLATRTTLESTRYRDLKRRHAADLTVLEYAPHHWIEAIEQGRESSPEFLCRLRDELGEIAAEGVDTWVLACTHFPFLIDRLAGFLDPAAQIIDPAPAVTAQLQRRLATPDGAPIAASLRLFTSGNPGALALRLQSLGIDTSEILLFDH